MFEARWIKGCESSHCVEVLPLKTMTKIRDSKDPNGPWLSFTTEEFDQFIGAVKAGVFDR